MLQLKTTGDPFKVMMLKGVLKSLIKGLLKGLLKGQLKGVQDQINSQHFKTSDIDKNNLPHFLKWFLLLNTFYI